MPRKSKAIFVDTSNVRSTLTSAHGKKRYRKRREPIQRFGFPVQKIYHRSIVPNIHKVKLPYTSSIISLTATSGVASYYLFNANDIYDPDRSGGGHQPMGRDQWANFYEQYRVTGIKVILTAFNATNASPICVSMGALNGTAGTTDGESAKESPRFMTKYGGNDQKAVFMKKYWQSPNVFGITKLQYDADKDYSGVVGAAPNNKSCIQIWAGPMDNATTTSIKLHLRIDYFVRYSNPKILAQS